jgi:hypothetical protein
MIKRMWLWIASFFIKKNIEEVENLEKCYVRALATNHARKRLEERHGEVLTNKMLVSFVSDIKNGTAKFVKETKNNTQSWIVIFNDKKYRVIYSTKEQLIITIYSGVKNRRSKPSRQQKNKYKSRLKISAAQKWENRKTPRKKPYKRKKRVSESSDYR